MALAPAGLGYNRPRGQQRVYAITFDFDTKRRRRRTV